MKTGFKGIFRVKFNGTETMCFTPYGFSESVHVIRTKINLSLFSLSNLLFDHVCTPFIIASSDFPSILTLRIFPQYVFQDRKRIQNHVECFKEDLPKLVL